MSTGCNLYVRVSLFRLVVGKRFSDQTEEFFCGAAGALGFALPAAVGASLAFGKRPVIALIGDGPPTTASLVYGPPPSSIFHARL
jgi:Thiamine pyrophosphate enzyme, C-terminal TPP binding domain